MQATCNNHSARPRTLGPKPRAKSRQAPAGHKGGSEDDAAAQSSASRQAHRELIRTGRRFLYEASCAAAVPESANKETGPEPEDCAEDNVPQVEPRLSVASSLINLNV